jgi:hypothetical protein
MLVRSPTFPAAMVDWLHDTDGCERDQSARAFPSQTGAIVSKHLREGRPADSAATHPPPMSEEPDRKVSDWES